MNKPCDISSYADLNDKLVYDFYDAYFFQKWKNGREEADGYDLELIFSPKCNLKCEYCYIHRNNENIYFRKPWVLANNIHNVELLLNWLYNNDYAPSLHIFSGELFAQEAGYQLIETILKFYQEHDDKPMPPAIVIPTNATFLKDESLANRVHDFHVKFSELSIDFLLSYSFDGLYADQITRKYKTDLDYNLHQELDQSYYETVFENMKEHGYLPHPMVSPENIHIWKENFMWFKEMFEKHDIALESLYLLEVRNKNWTAEKIQELVSFIEFLMDFWWESYDHDAEKFVDFLLSAKKEKGVSGGNNILKNNFYSQGTSCQSGCSISNYMMVNLNDLSIVPCHRLMYPELTMAHFEEQEDHSLVLKSDNTELNIGIHSFSPSSLPLCSTCIINHLCCTPCYGSNYETTKDMFTPIPSVCQMEYAKVRAILSKLLEYDKAYETFLDKFSTPMVLKIRHFVKTEIKEIKE